MFQNIILVQTDLMVHKMAKKYWVELGDMVVEMDTIIKLMKKYEAEE